MICAKKLTSQIYQGQVQNGGALIVCWGSGKSGKASAKVTGHKMSDKRGKAQQRAFGCLVTQFEGLLLDGFGCGIGFGFGFIMTAKMGEPASESTC